MSGLRQALISASISVPRHSNKADLQALYASLQAGSPPPTATPSSKATDKASRGHSVPYSRPKQTTTPSRMNLQPSGHSKRLSASLGRTLDAAAAGLRSAKSQLAAPPVEAPAFASTSCHDSVNMPPLAVQSYPQPLSYPTPNPLPYPWPAAPPSSSSVRLPPQPAQAPTPPFPISFPLL